MEYALVEVVNRSFISKPSFLALTDTNEQNGCLRVYPETQTGGYRPFQIAVPSPKSMSGGRPTELAESDSLPTPTTVPLSAGSACLLSVCLVHDSKPNLTDAFRIGINVRFISVGAVRRATERVPPFLSVRGSASNYSVAQAEYPNWSDEEGFRLFQKTIRPKQDPN
jgi:ectoine hydroxylase-related dioxygenase (phytanoyl-CoA dioxygenase family)